MKKTIISVLLAAAIPALNAAAGTTDDIMYSLRLGYGFGGTTPVGMPQTIRSLDSYGLEPNITLGLDMYKSLKGRWGLTLGLHIENKGMDIDATVKNYHMEIIRGGQSLEGYFTGHNATKAEQWMLTVPVQATFSFSENLRLRLGPYFSYVHSHSFTGYAYDGYLRVGSPTGTKVELGSVAGNCGTYDFSDSMRHIQVGMMLDTDWYFYKQWGVFADLSWGLSGVFNSSFNTIEQTLYPIYGTIGISYKLK